MSRWKHIARLVPAHPLARSFLVLALALGSAFAVMNPPFAVNDERDHWLRVVEMTKGRLRTRADAEGAYYMLPRDYYQLILRYGQVTRDGEPPVKVKRIARDLVTPAEQPPHWTRREATASVYSPVPYAPHLPAVGLARLFHLPPIWQVYWARFASLACYSLITAWAISFAGELGWIWFVLGLMPMTLIQAAALSGDGMCEAVSFLFFALVAKGTFGEQPLSRAELRKLLALAALLPLCKPPNLLFVGATLALRWDGPRPQLRRWLTFAGTLALSVSALLLWSYINRGPAGSGNGRVEDQVQWLKEHLDSVPSIAVNTLFTRIDDYVIQFVAIRDVVSNQMRFSGAVLAGLLLPLLLAVTLGAARSALSRRPGLRLATLWIALSGLATSGAVFLGMYLFATDTGASAVAGTQGRYFIPIAPALLLPLSTLGSPTLGRWLERHDGRRVKRTLVLVNILALLALTARYYGSSKVDWPY